MRPKPLSVVIALSLIVLAFVLAIVRIGMIFQWQNFTGLSLIAVFGGLALIPAALYGLFVFFLSRGSHLARWIFLVFPVLVLFRNFSRIGEPPFDISIASLHSWFLIAAAIFLFLPTSTRWFYFRDESTNASKQNA